jgi:probable HAF family extracellular repeat protein
VIWGLDGAASAIGSTIYRGQAQDINDSGQVVGWSEGHGFVWTEEDGMADLGSFSPTAINNAGVTVGSVNSQACTWEAGVGAIPLPQLSGTTGGAPLDINDRGQIVGTAVIDNSWHGVLWNPDGSIVDFGQFDDMALNQIRINNSGQIAVGNRLFTPVPEPAALLTLLCGVGGMVAMCGRRRR